MMESIVDRHPVCATIWVERDELKEIGWVII